MSTKLQITHLSYSSAGGAGSIASKLVAAQQELGYQSRLVTASNKSLSADPLGDPVQTLAAVIDQFVLAKKSSELISVFRGKISRLSREIRNQGHVVHLHWLPGAISMTLLAELSKNSVRTVWTLHDYRPLTGACHYPQGCNGFESGCTSCPQVRPLARQIIATNQSTNLMGLSELEVDFVAPSSGLFEAAQRSQIGAAQSVHLIPNPVSVAQPGASIARREHAQARGFLFVAANVNEARKGLEATMDWWSRNRRDEEVLKIVGKGSQKLSNSTIGVLGLGELTQGELAVQYQSAAALVFSSSEDNAPGVLAEAAYFGLPTICLDPQMAVWLEADGFPLSQLDEVRRGANAGQLEPQIDYSEFLLQRRPEVVARKYLELYFGERS
jgi:glycosyltransferase involved in cell wall biosynthesis